MPIVPPPVVPNFEKSGQNPIPEYTNKSESSSDKKSVIPSLSLPKGGGAIKGMGEKFSTNPVTGTGSMSVPVPITPGRSGFGPQLSLSYDSGSGNGIFGFGWSISIPSITRKTDKGIPRYRDGDQSDVFILSGAEDLVPVGSPTPRDKYSITTYRPRTEGLFARIERWSDTTDSENVFWRSISKDNITTIYGMDSNSRIADPGDRSRIFSWLICESYDDKGNAILYHYQEENAVGVDVSQIHEKNRNNGIRTTNRYLQNIWYGNTVPFFREDPFVFVANKFTNPKKSEDWLFEVVFDYAEPDLVHPANGINGECPVRPDAVSSYRSGFEIRTYRLCHRILMVHHFPEELGVDDYLVRSMDFSYEKNAIASFIKKITQYGYTRDKITGAYTNKSLPPLEFVYSEAKIHDEIEFLDADSLRNLPIGLDGSQYQWVDLDGEGISGILTEQGDAWYYKENLGGGRFGAMQAVASVPATAGLAGGRQQLMDLAGDGSLDLVEFSGPVSGFYERTSDGGWDMFRPFDSLPNIPWNNPNMKFIDLNGDGHADVLITEGESLNWFPSLAESGFSMSERVYLPADEEMGPRLIFADGTQSVYLADLSGDGLSDLVRIRNGEICYWPNFGYGKFGAKVTMDNSPVFDTPDLFDQKRIRLVDADGSGTTDILYLRHDRIDVYLNQSGNSWKDPQSITQMPPIDDLSSVTTVDLFGNGTGCLVWSSPLPQMTARQMSYIRLMGDKKPHLLISTKNNMGAETVVTYASSTEFYLADKAAGTPWVTRLPFPVHVVSRVDTCDKISRNLFVTRYSYHHGYFDGIEREFQGFARVDQTDTEEYAVLSANDAFPGVPTAVNVDEASHVPPVLTRTWYHTGVYFEGEEISRQLAHEYYGALDPADTAAFDQFLDEKTLPDTILPDGLTADEEREACRALRGSILRQEIYAHDDSDKKDKPYSISERNYTIRCLQPHGENRHAVFFVHPRETIDYHCERDPDDPRISHAMTFEVDDYGNVLKSVAIGYGRLQADAWLTTSDDQKKQTDTLITYTESIFTNPVDETNNYRAPLPSEVKTYELTGFKRTDTTPRFTFEDFLICESGKIKVTNGHVELDYCSGSDINYEIWNTGGSDKRRRRLIEHVRTLYRKDDLSGLLGLKKDPRQKLITLEPLALHGETYKLAFTQGLLSDIYKRPPVTGTEDLLKDPAGMLGKDGGYIRSRDYKDLGLFPDKDPDGNWWIPSGRIYYSKSLSGEEGFAKDHFFLPHRFDDPFGNKTFIEYDTVNLPPKKKNYNLLVVRIEDPLANTVVAHNNYRVMQPSSITDPNGTLSEAQFDKLGLVVRTAIHKGTQGDLLPDPQTYPSDNQIDDFFIDPRKKAAGWLGTATSCIVYDIDRFKEKGEPPVAATIVRETHNSNPVPPGGLKVQVSLSYSDGFGREIQKKIQAEAGQVPKRDPVTGKIIVENEKVQFIDNPNPFRWVGSGWTVFNNKGKPVRQYEPFFSDTHEFDFDVKVGVSLVIFYDPVGRVIATLHPNHTYEKVVFSPWMQKTYDVNDTVTMDPRNDADIGNYVERYFKQVATGPVPWQIWIRQRGIDPSQIFISLPTDPDKKAAILTLAHANTPTTAYFDTLGRTFLTVALNNSQRWDDPKPSMVSETFETRVIFDIEGNQRTVIDALGRTVMVYDYDMLSNRIRQQSMDAGTRWMLNDVAGNPAYGWDRMGRTIRHEYDDLRRQTRLIVSEKDPGGNDSTFLAERTVYGEVHPDSRELNLRGKVLLMLDGAGLVVNCARNPVSSKIESYDFKGNLLRSTRHLTGDYTKVPDWSTVKDTVESEAAKPGSVTRTGFLADSGLDALLETESFTGCTRYDALNRPIQSIASHSNDGKDLLSITQLVYNDANLLDGVDVWLQQKEELAGLMDPSTADQHIVKNVDYNEKGQRLFIEYGNNVKTQYEYDPLTFRLIDLHTVRDPGNFAGDCWRTDPEDSRSKTAEKCPDPPKACRSPRGSPCGVQNIHYNYDPAGNIVYIQDDAQQKIFYSGSVVTPTGAYNYDSTYRLIQAWGREHKGTSINPWPSWNDRERMFRLDSVADGRQMLNYTESYLYDAAGNIDEIDHHGTNNGTNIDWIRKFTLQFDQNDPTHTKINNRLYQCNVNGTTAKYHYDAHGNIVSMPPFNIENSENTPPYSWPMVWDYKDQLVKVQKSKKSGPDPEKCTGCYVYFTNDAGGQRVRKVMEHDGKKIHERIYIGGFEIFRKYGTGALERESLHVMDDKQRIVLIDIKTKDASWIDKHDPEILYRYQFGNHLGSAVVELDESGQRISYEEYYPYGGTSYQAVIRTSSKGYEVSAKRYRYTGKERDEETGLYYHRARYYAPCLGRWVTCDPAGFIEGTNVYVFCRNAPSTRVEIDGKDSASATEIRSASQAGLDMGRVERLRKMDEIAARFGIPAGGFTGGQSRLVVNRDIRLFWLLRTLARVRSSQAAAANLAAAYQHVPEVPSSLVLTTSARENDTSVTARGSRMVNTWGEGGLDFLWQNRNRLGLPPTMTRHWTAAPTFVSPETGIVVHPGLIPERDQVPAYAAQIRMSFTGFERQVRQALGDARGNAVLGAMSDEARLVWQAYSFMAPGGVDFDPRGPSQHGQRFGVHTALGYLIDKANREGRDVDLNELLTDPTFNRTEYIRIAKVRAAEAAFFDERLLSTAPTSPERQPSAFQYGCIRGVSPPP